MFVAGYIINGVPSSGCEGTQPSTAVAETVLKTLVDPVHYSAINVTDN